MDSSPFPVHNGVLSKPSKLTNMKIADNISLLNVNTHGGGEIPPCTGLTPGVLPEVQRSSLAKNLQTGLSARNVLSLTDEKKDIAVLTFHVP